MSEPPLRASSADAAADAALVAVARLVARATGARFAGVALHSPASTELGEGRIVADRDSAAVVAAAARRASPRLRPADPPTVDETLLPGLTLVLAPIGSTDTVVALLVVADHSGHQWRDADLAAVADAAAAAASLTAAPDAERRALARTPQAPRAATDEERQSDVGSFSWDLATDTIRWSEEVNRMLGWSSGAVAIGQRSFLDAVHPDDRDIVFDRVKRAVTRGESFSLDMRVIRPSGAVRVMHVRASLEVSATGEAVRITGICQDVTDRQRFDVALERRGALLGAIVETMREVATTELEVAPMMRQIAERARDLVHADGAAIGHLDGDFVVYDVASAGLSRIQGLRVGIGDSLTGFCLESEEVVRCDDTEIDPRASLERIRAVGIRSMIMIPLAYRRAATGVLAVGARRTHAFTDEDVHVLQLMGGVLAALVSHAREFEERTAALEALKVAHETLLKESEERDRLEARLRQAQRMEAVGQLAGGIAHDFNNLLTVIQLHSELLLDGMAGDDPHREDAEQIQRQAERAAALTRQLLAFSRKQLLQPRLLDLNAAIRDVEAMLRRLVGEDVSLLTRLAPDLGRVMADPNQLVQVFLNLVGNSRDAMPGGGTITIETANVELDESYGDRHGAVVPAGPYVMVAVSDTGTGMDTATRARVFEPFFTTKEPGRGTGLGLATVYGVVKQSGGWVWVYSEPGQGTVFKIYMPRVDSDGEQGTAAARTPDPRGDETILLVEDDAELRDLARQLLAQLGYRLLVAADGVEALATAHRHPAPIHLLATDVVLPQMSGSALAAQLRAVRPELRVLYMSGYTDDEIVRRGLLAPSTVFLQKPFTRRGLAEAVRTALDSKTG
jgi:PAS domain S-box-containing protein